jgi:hypothetical protein
MDDYLHREGVTAVRWVYEPVLRVHLLVSASAEGRVQVWSQANGFAFPLQSYQLAIKPKLRAATAAEDDGRGAGSAGGRRGDDDEDERDAASRGRSAGGRGGGRDRKLVPGGVTCLDFPLLGGSSGMFVAGTEAGSLHRCGTQLNPQAMDSALAEAHVAAAAAAGVRPGPRPGGGGGPAYVKPGGISGAETTVPWERAAVLALTRLPPAERSQAARAVERYAREVGSAAVALRLLYAARCDPRCLFPNPIVLDYTSHAAPVLAVACSPHNRNIFASGGGDGRLCIFSALSQSPLLTFEPGLRSSALSRRAGGGDGGSLGGGPAGGGPGVSPGPASSRAGPAGSSSGGASAAASATGSIPSILGVAWSRARPCVLAAATSDGAVSVYDLYVGTAAPAATLRCDGTYDGIRSNAGRPGLGAGAAAGSGSGESGAGALSPLSAHDDADATPAATAVAFNPKQRRLLAVGDSNGRLHLWKLAWRLGNEQPQEERALNLFAQAAAARSGAEGAAGAGAGGSGRAGGAAAGADAVPANSLAAFRTAVAKKMDAARDML